jgi:hypothetical protein
MQHLTADQTPFHKPYGVRSGPEHPHQERYAGEYKGAPFKTETDRALDLE